MLSNGDYLHNNYIPSTISQINGDLSNNYVPFLNNFENVLNPSIPNSLINENGNFFFFKNCLLNMIHFIITKRILKF